MSSENEHTDKNEESIYDDTIILGDDEGNEREFRILRNDLFVQEKQYVVLLSVETEDCNESEIVILRVDGLEQDEVTLSTIDDVDEWNEVINVFEEMDMDDVFEE